MGVDYTGQYGIGYEVEYVEHTDADGDDLGMADFLDESLSDGFEWFQVGNGSYSGRPDRYFVAIEKPFDGGLDLTNKKKSLDAELERIGLTPIGEFNVIGGLYVW